MRILFPKKLSIFSCLLALLTAPASWAAEKPNIVLIFTDDQGYGDLGIHGVEPHARTPHLDQLARDGVLFTDGYVTAPQCAPSRAGLMTGRYQTRFDYEHIGSGPLPLDEVTLADRLSDLGYRTGMVGKWHLEPNNATRRWAAEHVPNYDPKEKVWIRWQYTEGYRPGERGFDDFFWGEYNNGFANYDLEGNTLPEPRRIQGPDYRIDSQTEAALAFLRRQSDAQPFFLYLAYYAPHVPLDAIDADLDLFDDPSLSMRRRYGLAMMHAMDRGIGQIRAQLEAQGMDENTLIIYMSDNGAPLLEHMDNRDTIEGNGWTGSLNTPFAGEKGMLSEGGIRVPFLAAWPGVIDHGQTVREPVTALDWAPTLLELAGAEALPEELDGHSLWPLLQSGAALPERPLFWRFWGQSAVRLGAWKLLIAGDHRWLFNLEEDPAERYDLSAHMPAKAQELERLLVVWESRNKPLRPLDERKLNGSERIWYQQHFTDAPTGRALPLENADFSRPAIKVPDGAAPYHTPPERREVPYATPEEWESEGLIRMGHAKRAPIGSRQVLNLVDGSVSQITPHGVQPDTLYTVEVVLRSYGFRPASFQASLYTTDQAGKEQELLHFGSDSTGDCFGGGTPLAGGTEWQTQRAIWFSKWPPSVVGDKLRLRIQGRLVEVKEVRLIAAADGTPPASPAWKVDSANLDPTTGGGSLSIYSHFFGYDSAINRPVTGQDQLAAYNYSAFMVQPSEGGPLHLFTGGRFRDESKSWDGDHILLHLGKNGPRKPFVSPYTEPRPITTQGRFEGEGSDYALEHWWTGNMMDPEVVVVDGKWHLFTQVQVNPGNIIDAKTGLRAEGPADQTQLHVSEDGREWTRWSRERGVVANVDNPTRTLKTHHEVIYAPWDVEKPWWLYVNTFIDYVKGSRDNKSQFYRIRSDDPTTFDWQTRERVDNFQHLGNQTAYLLESEEAAPLLLRITHRKFADIDRHNLILQYSSDGLTWFTLGGEDAPLQLDGSRNELLNRSSIFPGLSTLDGQGRIESLGDGWYRAFYAATTANGGGQPAIWYSQIGLGWIYFHFER